MPDGQPFSAGGPARDGATGSAFAECRGAAALPELASAHAFFAHIVNALPNPVFVKDERHRWVCFNDAFCEVLGRSHGELLGKSDFDFLPEEQARIFWQRDRAVFASGSASENEEALTDSTGVTRWIVTRKSVVEVPGCGRFLVGVIADISERKSA
jgi:PAS domain S-box-containing protein